jgi:hypothetical protein
MLGAPFTHEIQLLFFVMNDSLVACFIEQVEICVCDKGCKRHDGVFAGVETSHLINALAVFEKSVIYPPYLAVYPYERDF